MYHSDLQPSRRNCEHSVPQGLSPAAFWRNVHQILDAGPAGCKGAVARLVEEERVRVALRSTGFGPGAETKLNGTEAEGTERERNGTGFRPGAERKLGGTERKGIGTGVGLGLERKLDGTERKGSETGSEPRAEANGLSHRTERNLDRADAAPDALDGGSDRGTGGRHRGKKVGDGTGEVPDRTNGLSRTESSLNGSNGLSDGARGPSKEVSRDQRDAQSVRREVTSARNDVSAETCPSHIAEGTERDAAAESVVGSLDDVPSEPAGSVEQSPCHQSQRPSKDGLPSTQNDGGRGGAAECHPYDDRGMRQSDGFRRGELGAGFNEGSGRLSFIGRTGLAIGGASCCEPNFSLARLQATLLLGVPSCGSDVHALSGYQRLLVLFPP